ncbi:MAG TPA: hypothetical protein VGC79_32860, partial [Polyangiaceae bacterium]
MSTIERNIHFGLLAASLSLAVWVFAAQPRSAEPATRGGALEPATERRSPLSILPPGSAFMLSMDVRALSRAPLGVFIAERLGRTAGTSKLAELCGFDPLARLDQLALAIPSADLAAMAQPDFGIVASGRFSAAEIIRCTNAAIAARGGEAIPSRLGSFDSVRDGKSSSGAIAVKDGLVVVSDGNYFRALLDSAEGKRKTSPEDARGVRHSELRRALGPAPLLVTWLLGEGWLERLTGGEPNARLSPLNALKSVGARVDVGHTVSLLVLLECADSAGATRISSLLDELRSSLKALPLDPALAGVAARIAVNQSGARLKLSLELNRA